MINERNEYSNTPKIDLQNLEKQVKDILNKHKPWYKKSLISLFTTIILTTSDFLTVKMLFEKTISGNATVLAFVASYILNFIAILWVDSLKNWYYGIEKRKSSIISFGTGVFTFVGLFTLTCFLRMSTKQLLFSSGAVITSSSGSVISTATTDTESAGAIAVSLVLCFLPLATTLVNALLAWISYDPIENNINQSAKTIVRTKADINEHTLALNQLSENETFISSVKALDDTKYRETKEYLIFDKEAFIDQINELIMAKINANSEDIDILSKHKYITERV